MYVQVSILNWQLNNGKFEFSYSGYAGSAAHAPNPQKTEKQIQNSNTPRCPPPPKFRLQTPLKAKINASDSEGVRLYLRSSQDNNPLLISTFGFYASSYVRVCSVFELCCCCLNRDL